MKKVIAASIEQLIEFDSIQEMTNYINKLNDRKIPHRCIKHDELENGKVRLHIKKQYNNNDLIED